MAIFRGAGGPGDATTDAANEASVASTKAAEAEASATAAASSAISASNSATTAINSKDAAATSESNAATSALAASTSEANAANSETNASDSESNAATSETNAANSASSALTSKNAAAISEANASTSETNASASASAASTSAASAAASYDGFDDRYLGAKSTDPTVDNDNDPLITGALYFNTTSNDMKVYNGSAWEVTFATLSGALVAANNLSDVVDVASSRTNLGLGTTDSPSFAGLTVDTNTISVDSTNNRVGIGLTNPSVKLNVSTDSGQIARFAAVSNNAAFEIISPEADYIALKAMVSDGLIFSTNNAESMRITSAGNVGIGTSSPTSSKLHIDGGDLRIQDVTPNIYFYSEGAVNNVQINANISDAAQGGIAIFENGNALIKSRTNYTQFYSANTERMRISGSGYVGIGETNPAKNLQISDSGTPTIRIQDTGGTNQYAELFVSSSSTILQARNDASDGIIQFRGFGGGTATEHMRITSTGNVGIGTSSPTSALDVNGTVTADGVSLGDNEKAIFGAGSDLQIYHNGANSYIDDTGTGNLYIRASDTVRLQSATGEQGVIVTTDGAVTLYHDNGAKLATTATGIDVTGTVVSDGLTVDTDTLYVDSTNNRVGIGTTSPSELLEVYGADPFISILNTGETLGGIKFADAQAPSTQNALLAFDSAGNSLEFSINNTEHMRITSTGRVGIGTTSPSGMLHLSGALPRIYFTDTDTATVSTFSGENGWLTLSAATSRITFNIDGSEKMRIVGDNVGIGTTSPVSLLHVKSTIPVVTADSLGFAGAGNGTGFGIYRSAAGRIAGYTWTITNAIRSGGSSGSDYQTDDLIFSRRASTTDSTLTEAMRITSEGIVDILGGTIELNGNQITGIEVTIADDAFATITPTGRYAGYLSVIASGDDIFPQHPFSGFLFSDFGNSPFNSSVNTGVNFDISVAGPPTGTTGTDGKVTLFTGGTSGTFYLENRSVTSRSFQITLM